MSAAPKDRPVCGLCEAVDGNGRPCRRPAVARNKLLALCEEHARLYDKVWMVDDAETAIYYLRRWLWVARDNDNEFLEARIQADLAAAEDRRRRAYEALEQSRDPTGHPE
jgi:hypothetical protein